MVPFVEGFTAFNFVAVNPDIGVTVFPLDEAVVCFGVKPLDGSFFHSVHLDSFWWGVTSVVPIVDWRVQWCRLLADTNNLAGGSVVFRGRVVVSRNRTVAR